MENLFSLSWISKFDVKLMKIRWKVRFITSLDVALPVPKSYVLALARFVPANIAQSFDCKIQIYKQEQERAHSMRPS